MSELSRAETLWLRKLQKVLDDCPSSRLAAYTIGDPMLVLFEADKTDAIHEVIDDTNNDFGCACTSIGADLGTIRMPFQVHSVAG